MTGELWVRNERDSGGVCPGASTDAVAGLTSIVTTIVTTTVTTAVTVTTTRVRHARIPRSRCIYTYTHTHT